MLGTATQGQGNWVGPEQGGCRTRVTRWASERVCVALWERRFLSESPGWPAGPAGCNRERGGQQSLREAETETERERWETET